MAVAAGVCPVRPTATRVPAYRTIHHARPDTEICPSNTFVRDGRPQAALFLKSLAAMMERTRPTSRRIVRWIFQRGNELLTCGVDRESDRSSYTLSLVPNSNVDAALVEMFESGVGALQRHAGIAAQLRELGWTLIAYTGERAACRRNYQPAAA